MEHKIKAVCGIREILRVGYGMKIAWRDWDALISIGGMRDSFETDSGMRYFNTKRPFENLTRWNRDKYSESGGMAGRSLNEWRDTGCKKPILDLQHLSCVKHFALNVHSFYRFDQNMIADRLCTFPIF